MKQTTTDLWFASYLKLQGFEISGYQQVARGKCIFEFCIDDKIWKENKLKFNNSEFSKFKQIQESLKDLGF